MSINLRIFLSSPGDVADERGLALQVIERLVYEPELRGRVTLEAIAWDKPGASAPMLATMTPQQAINEGLPRPSECDIVVVILWARMGTPLPPEYKKSDGSRFRSGTEWEYEDAVQAAEATGSPGVIVYRRASDIVLNPADPDFMAKYEQWQQVQSFFQQFVDEDGTIRRGYNRYQQPDDFRVQFEQHLKKLIIRHLDQHTTAIILDEKDAPATGWQGSPFPGLRAFTPADAPIFFGRGRETDDLVGRLFVERFLAVIGASGSGKSSLVGAGLVPRLEANALPGSKDWVLVRFTPGGGNPFDKLAVALQTEFHTLDQAVMAEQLMEEPTQLNEIVAKLLKGRPTWAEVVFFVDQFEELFTLVDVHYRVPFVAMLAASGDRVRFVLTLRADFYRQCVKYPALAALLRSGSYPLAAPGMAALYEMVARPAALAGLRFEDGLVQRILDDTGDDPGALALLAYTLDELYRVSSGTLTHESYEQLGGVQGAIAQRAEGVFRSLDAEAQAALPSVFQELVSVNDNGVATRRRVPLESVLEDEAAERLVTALTGARLLVQSHEDGRAVVEVAHEALLHNWSVLVDWIDDRGDDLRLLRQLRHAAHLWHQHERSDDFLWVGKRLQAAVAMVERLRPVLSEAEYEFVTPEQERLLQEVNDPTVPHYRRALIGERLNEIGDTRPGVGLTGDGLPDIVWCDVPGGEITLIASKSVVSLDHLTFEVQPFRMARYPITYSQFQSFVTAEDGYHNPRWWEGIGTHKKLPTQNRPFDNHPVEYVSWYDAIAFCRWLTERLQMEVRLPTEWEWQLAATGGLPNYRFPWGNQWETTWANTRESDLLRTTAVGMYPQNTSPVGGMDMIGNVWEWCLNELEVPSNVALGGTRKRSLRGCSCLSRSHKAHITYRAGNVPNRRNEAHGFRVCAM